MSKTKTITARAKAFSGYPMQTYRFRVDLGDGSVSVYDSVAGHYTVAHSLTKSAIKRIRELAVSAI